MNELGGPDEVMIFFRIGGFYLVQGLRGMDLRQQARDHAELNPGTLRVEDARGDALWIKPPPDADAGKGGDDPRSHASRACPTGRPTTGRVPGADHGPPMGSEPAAMPRSKLRNARTRARERAKG